MGTGRERVEFFSACKICGTLGVQKSRHGSPLTGVIHEGKLMDASIVPTPAPAIQGGSQR